MGDQPNGNGLVKIFETLGLFPDPARVDARVRQVSGGSLNGNRAGLARSEISAITMKLTGAGVVAALPGAVPGLGTAAQVAATGGSMTAETYMILRNLAAMQFIVAGLYGHDVFAPERKEETAIIFGLQTGVIQPAKEVGAKLGTKIAVKQFNRHVSGAVFRKINQKVGTTVVTKWGVKRGGIAVGRLIPFGVGSAVGGGMNYLSARGFGRAVMTYYDDLLPNDGDVVIVD
jgi:hypothetical protein